MEGLADLEKKAFIGIAAKTAGKYIIPKLISAKKAVSPVMQNVISSYKPVASKAVSAAASRVGGLAKGMVSGQSWKSAAGWTVGPELAMKAANKLSGTSPEAIKATVANAGNAVNKFSRNLINSTYSGGLSNLKNIF